jgi:hypothetical protein
MVKPRLNVGSASLRGMVTPETMTLWLLVGLELGAHVGLRRYYRRHHGG